MVTRYYYTTKENILFGPLVLELRNRTKQIKFRVVAEHFREDLELILFLRYSEFMVFPSKLLNCYEGYIRIDSWVFTKGKIRIRYQIVLKEILIFLVILNRFSHRDCLHAVCKVKNCFFFSYKYCNLIFVY